MCTQKCKELRLIHFASVMLLNQMVSILVRTLQSFLELPELSGTLPGALGLSLAFPGISRASLGSPDLSRTKKKTENIKKIKKIRKSDFPEIRVAFLVGGIGQKGPLNQGEKGSRGFSRIS